MTAQNARLAKKYPIIEVSITDEILRLSPLYKCEQGLICIPIIFPIGIQLGGRVKKRFRYDGPRKDRCYFSLNKG